MNTDPVMLDDIDRGLVHALQIDGRAPLRTLGEVLGVSENTVARRYRRLRSAGVLRVVGAFNGARLGYRAWTIRLRCTPDAAGPLARALAARPDTSYVHLLSGGTEISCSAQTRSGEESDALLLHRLPRTGRITSVSAHLLLDHSALPSGWAGPALLSGEQTAALGPPPVDGTEDVTLEEGDRALFDALSRDGRASHAELAAATGWSDSTIRRRLLALRRAGVPTVKRAGAPLPIRPPLVRGFGAMVSCAGLRRCRIESFQAFVSSVRCSACPKGSWSAWPCSTFRSRSCAATGRASRSPRTSTGSGRRPSPRPATTS
ncbi:AsnC family transcriptional regulator [Streptomyces sparsogenes]|uniref:AsnC family transcriptional regulator n=1 Tax=Streptomyces sparsogenes TaxID=67365 RepID=UPI0033F08A5B